MPRFNLSLRFYDQDAIYDYIDGIRDDLVIQQHLSGAMARHLGFMTEDWVTHIAPPRTRENLVKLALLGVSITVAKHRGGSIPPARRNELMQNVIWAETPQGRDFWADRHRGEVGESFHQVTFGQQIGEMLLRPAQSISWLWLSDGRSRRVAELVEDNPATTVPTPDPVAGDSHVAAIGSTEIRTAPFAAFEETTAASGGFNLEQFVRVERGLRPTRRIFPSAWESYLGHTQDNMPRWKLRILAVMAALAQTRVGETPDTNLDEAVNDYLTWSCWPENCNWAALRRGSMTSEKRETINRYGLQGARLQRNGRARSGRTFVPPGFAVEESAPAEGRATGMSPSIQALQSCCAGTVIAAWGHGDPDRRNQGMTKADVRRFHSNQLAAGAGRTFQLAVLHDNQVAQLTRGFLEELGWERVKDLDNNSGRRVLSLWVRNPS